MGLIIIILQANVTVGTADAFLLARAKLFIYLETGKDGRAVLKHGGKQHILRCHQANRAG
ncbi:unnamed protein product [Fusarium graminearum]|nr:unnamed protein product [Fusarium graminearum]